MSENQTSKPLPLIVGITGATGTILAIRLIEKVREKNVPVHVIASKAGLQVAKYEADLDLKAWVRDQGDGTEWISNDNLFAGSASGSYPTRGMIIVPCSMGTLGKIAHGVLSDLLERAADVTIKEQRRLVLCPREAPLSPIHLENMTKLAQIGTVIMPPMLEFYTKPKTADDQVNFFVLRALDQLGLSDIDDRPRWRM